MQDTALGWLAAGTRQQGVNASDKQMYNSFRYSWLIGAAVVLSFGQVLDGPIGFDPSPAFAQGNSEGQGGGRGQSAGKGGDRGNSSSSPGHTGTSSFASRGKNSDTSPHALYASVKDEYGFKNFGEFSSYIKSWRSAWRNPEAYEATMGNLNSLPERQYAYADAFVTRQTALQAFMTAAPAVDPNSLPTLNEYNDALAVLGVFDAQNVVDTGMPTYSQDQINAANTVLQYEQYPEWDTYQKAVASADAALLATLPGNPRVIDPDLRALVDQIVVQIHLAGADASLY